MPDPKLCTYCGQAGHRAHACPRRPSVRARIFPGDDTLAIVEACTIEALQAATGAPAFMHTGDEAWPVSAIVPAEGVRQLLGSSSSLGTP